MPTKYRNTKTANGKANAPLEMDLRSLLDDIENDERKEKLASKRDAQAIEFRRIMTAIIDKRLSEYFDSKPGFYTDLQIAQGLRATVQHQGEAVKSLEERLNVDHEQVQSLIGIARRKSEDVEKYIKPLNGFLGRLFWLFFGSKKRVDGRGEVSGDE